MGRKVVKVKQGIYFIRGERKEVNSRMAEFSAQMLETGKVLYIDTVNSLNPHHPAYQGTRQEELLKRIFCARVPKHYDLYVRLKCAENFIGKNNVKTLIINSLTLVFEEADEDEVNPLMRHIMDLVRELTQKYQLITLIGCSPSKEIPVRQALATIKTMGADAGTEAEAVA